jgi:hypothetical protein
LELVLIDSQWFWRRLENDGLIVRMHIHTPPGKAAVTEIRAYVCWNDDMFYNRGLVIFEHDDDKRHTTVKPLLVAEPRRVRLPLSQRLRMRRPIRSSPVRPLGLTDRSYSVEWEELFREWTADWPPHWNFPEDVICTKGTSLNTAWQISTRSPDALVQLARFQTAANFTDNRRWSITLGIIERRVGGIIRTNLR